MEKQRGGLQLLALSSVFGFSVTQPTLDLLGRYPQFFVARGTTRAELLCLVAMLAVGAPAIGFALIRLCSAFRPALGRWAYRALIALGAALFILLALKRIPDLAGSYRWVGLALAGGAFFALAHARFGPVRLFLRILAPAPLIFAFAFLTGPATRALLSASDTALPPVKIGSPAPVVMVILDELPLATLLDETGAIDRRLFPHFAGLARGADWYRNATTVADSTELSVPAVLSGRYPKAIHGRLATSADYPNTLFTLLGGHYDLRVTESGTNLCPTSLCTPVAGGWPARLASLTLDVSTLYLHLVLPPGLQRRLPRVDQTWRGFVRFSDLPVALERDPVEAFSTFLESIQPGPRPTFSFLHLQLPHPPWVFLPSGKRYLPWRVNYTSPPVWDDQAALVGLGFQQHLLQTMLADRLLGRLVGRLKELGLYDETLLIVLSDHGASFRPGKERRAVTLETFRDIASIPLLIKTPRQREGRVLDLNAQTVDVAPTVADILDVTPSWPADGRSLLSDAASERPLKIIFGGLHASGLVLAPDLSALEGTVVCEHGAPAFKIEPGRLTAHLDGVAQKEDRVWFGGWAADLQTKRSADSILVFADGKLVFRGPTGIPRPDVVSTFPGRAPPNAGFAFGVDSAHFNGGGEVRLIAVGEGKATEVRYPSDFRFSRPKTPSKPLPEANCGSGSETRLVRVWTEVPDSARWPARLVELARSADKQGLFKFPPCDRLIGRSVSGRETVGQGWTALLDDPEALRRVDPASGYLPAAVGGTLKANGPPVPRQVAVAVNEVIAGLAPTFRSPEGERRFLVPVPEALLQPGPNRVAVFGVAEDECRLLRIGAKGSPAPNARTPIPK